MKSIPHSFYNSPEWKSCQALYMDSVNHLCERCKRQGLFNPAKIVHHKRYLTRENFKDPSIAYGFDNLEALCLDCHNKEHFKGERRYKIIGGELVIE